MAFPFLFEETFDDGTRGNFDSETDASNILDYSSYKELARQGLSPFGGAHTLRVRLSGTATAYVQDAFVDSVSVVSFWFPVLIGVDLELTDGDAINILEVRSAANAEAFFGIRRSGADYQLYAGETADLRTLTISRSNSKYHQVELVIDRTLGTIDFYVDGGQVGTQVSAPTMAAFTNIRLGAPAGTAAGNAGTVLVGHLIADDLRVFPRKRFSQDTVWVTRDQVAYIGSGTLDGVELTGTSTDAVLSILDTDIYEASLTNFSREPLVYVRNVSANEIVPGLTVPKTFHRGLYVQLTGTNPQAWLSIGSGSSVVLSHSNYVDRARK